jgi:F-type H+-transporting ATPase subunit b
MLAGLTYAVLAVAPEGNGTLLDVNPGLIFWTVITFIALMWILKKIAWKPILAALDQRENAIRDALERAEKAKDEAQKLMDENKANLAKADEESKLIIEQSRSYAAKLKDQMLQESKQQARQIVDDAMAEIERKKLTAFNELKSEVAGIAIQAAEKILRENLNKESQNRIVNNYLNEINDN